MPRIHDRGGWPDIGPIDRDEHDPTMWEKRTDALMRALRSRHYIEVDELRRAIESIDPLRYEQLTYYERWAEAIEILLVEKGVINRDEIERKIAVQDAGGF
ncbi:SH3-like domain-containing protein [Candidatus Entotheonella palauensis]|uniref:SH3-like domain-containing protein n=1 Tax=Candidatus Entotheonella palauensis TaxID=93172 RepID=UPI0015C43788|nr:SH3-like domain-containing protein [Candidatus Entotheonella palauensis]